MDRFIASFITTFLFKTVNLKSNMDRFIEVVLSAIGAFLGI